ncbi:MAG: EamA family transporter [Ruminococcaceae bacterium]|nr:EamA family transporter [Oscillospiraceae bacterium]
MNIKKDTLPTISLLLAATLWGLTGIFVRNLTQMGLSTFDMIFFRSSVTAISMLIFLLITDRSKLKIDIRDWWYFFGTGILSFLLFGFCYFYTIKNASMSLAAILLYTSPFFVIIMARIFFKEKITAGKVIGLLLAVIGCFLICNTDKNVKITPLIIFTGLSSGFCYALYSIFGRVALKKYDSSTVTFYTFLFAFIGTVFVVDLKSLSQAIISAPQSLPLSILFAFVSAVLPYVFYTYGLKYTEAGKASIIATLEAVVASISGVLVFGEKIQPAGVLGIILVLLAVAMLNTKKQLNS